MIAIKIAIEFLIDLLTEKGCCQDGRKGHLFVALHGGANNNVHIQYRIGYGTECNFNEFGI